MKKLILALFGLFIFSNIFSQTSLNIRAFIDGKDQIIIKDSTVQWQHYKYAAPGRLSHQNLPTYLNGMEWHPVWADIPDDENRQECFSSVFTELSIVLPHIEHNYSINKLNARGNVFIVQQPKETNNFTLVIEFNDSVPVGAEWYEVSIDSIATDIKHITNSKFDEIRIYPNPTIGKLIVELTPNLYQQLQIYDSVGQIVFSDWVEFGVSYKRLNMDKLKRGIYFITLRNKHSSLTKKFIVNYSLTLPFLVRMDK